MKRPSSLMGSILSVAVRCTSQLVVNSAQEATSWYSCVKECAMQSSCLTIVWGAARGRLRYQEFQGHFVDGLDMDASGRPIGLFGCISYKVELDSDCVDSGC